MRIRQAVSEDLAELIKIEQICFPAAEAALKQEIEERFAAFGENFFAAQEGERVIGFINGAAVDEPILPDELYHDISLHKPNGAWQTVFGLDVLPEFRRRGTGEALLLHLIEAARQRGKRGVILTCKNQLIPFYEKAGFRFRGVSASCHGGAVWNDMLLEFKALDEKETCNHKEME